MRNLLIAVCYLCLAWQSQANDEPQSENNDYIFSFGISYLTVELEVADEHSLIAKGILAEEAPNSYFLSLTTPYRYVGEDWGYYFEYNYSTFNLKHQRLTDFGDEFADLGTSATGYYAYFAPTVFYNFGDRYIKNGDGSNFKFGAGLGLGYLKAKGTILLNLVTPVTLHSFDIADFGYSVVVFLDYRYGNWMLKYSLNGPSINKNGYNYGVYEETIDVGYTIAF